MPVPKRRTGKAKKNMRRSHHALTSKSLISCASCGEPNIPHRVCPKCGYYKERLIVKNAGE